LNWALIKDVCREAYFSIPPFPKISREEPRALASFADNFFRVRLTSPLLRRQSRKALQGNTKAELINTLDFKDRRLRSSFMI